MSGTRSLNFKNKDKNRYWWFSDNSIDYVPPIFSILTDEEWEVLASWYEDTDTRYPAGSGDCNIPAISMLMGLIMGNNVSRIIQCGHYIGFSTLLIGFMVHKMRKRTALYSIDIDPSVTAYTQQWVARAGLDDYVRLVVADTADASQIPEALEYLNGKPQVIFIDSSHEYKHTLSELDLWFPSVQPGGFIVLHDVSDFAVDFDPLHGRGVKGALAEWSVNQDVESIMINTFCGPEHYGSRTVYKDACGLGIIQKAS